MVFPLGSLVDALAIMGGGTVGMLLGARIPEKTRTLVFQGLGLCVMVVGLQAALAGTKPMITIASIVGGGVLGEILGLEDRLSELGEWLKRRVSSSNPRFTEGMVNGSVIFCIGAMSILGSLEEGLRGSRDIIYAKSIIDAFAAVIMGAGYGLGVVFSGVTVLIYQGALVLGASALAGVLTDVVVAEISATGGVIIVGIGFNLLGATQIRLANLVPALLLAPLLALLFG